MTNMKKGKKKDKLSINESKMIMEENNEDEDP